jgi:hypothetical protein
VGCHFGGSWAASGPWTRYGAVKRPRKAGLKLAAGVALPNMALTAASR